MNRVAVALTLIATSLFVFMSGIFAQTSSYGCSIQKFLPLSAQPYDRQVICGGSIEYPNGTIFNYPRTLYWCIHGTILDGPMGKECIVYNPGKEAAASEPEGTQGASPGLSPNLDSEDNIMDKGELDVPPKDTSEETEDEEPSNDENNDEFIKEPGKIEIPNLK